MINYQFPANGEFTASFGRGVDVGAPATTSLVLTTAMGNAYAPFNGTSAATPHVAGVVGLLMSYLNTPTPSYQNLAPEDCERIIELSAKDDDYIIGVDDYIGHGLLDAGKAMKLVEQPWNKLYHFANNNSGWKKKTLTGTNVPINIVERVQDSNGNWVMSGNYLADVYRIDTNVPHALDANFNIEAYWPRHSSSTVMEAIDGSGNLRPRERVVITSCTPTECKMSGYVYKLYTTGGTPIGWLPFDTTLAWSHFEYSILARSSLAPVGIKEYTRSGGIELYPNPAMDGQTLKIQAKGASKIAVNLFDAQGRYVRNVYNGKAYSGDIIVQSTIADLAPALYFYSIEIDDKPTYLRFIKQ